ncbi:MAG: UDP-N-acetylmuramate--L-alanine ligase [Candidatus Pseudobacter hemicellulosilyticus]|uniref:UDP-N-acetylmuramate--L-alanine ligase n=1 Tax=Candidatus Pseudobacter hemicellulosilyticus TaxID=3121375 RepID=A0AAJ6BJT5_9BACT|nr:MAG: UDP-N-acetylmuramate--L-alanine ligase [Pseudobacter sp.]
MIRLEDIQKVYFIGIGGIGMSALARYFAFHGREVSGYDKTETVLTKQLVSEGIPVHYKEDLELAPKDAQLVVYTPAVPANHAELEYYRRHNYTLMKRSEVLGVITQGSFNICVAGTHGKTTITTMIAHLLRHSGYGCNAFLGGVAVNYNSNYWSNERNVCVVEADEYDRSFLRLSPDIAVITAMDADHLDIYGTAENMEAAFIEFSGKLKPGGTLISKYGLEKNDELKGDQHLLYHQQDQRADVFAANVRMFHGSYQFNVISKDWILRDVVLHMGGLHNIENVVAAIAVAHQLGIEDDKIKAAVEAFKGVKRRFEYIIKSDKPGKTVYVDDYAHHPEELRALISGAKGLFPDMKCTVIFQPHLFTRTRDFAAEFAQSLELADEVVLLPIYPARELPIEGVTSNMILEHINKEEKYLLNKHQVLDWVKQARREGWLLLSAGAGDIDTLVQPLKELLAK